MISLKYNPADMRFIVVCHDNTLKTVYNSKSKKYEQRREISLLEDFLNQVPKYQYLPSYSGIIHPTVFLNKKKMPDNTFLYWCNSGLWKTIYDWCDEQGIEHNNLRDDFKYTSFSMSLEDFEEYVSGWGLSIKPRDYQLKAAWLILHYKQSLSQLATRAGKTLIAYIVFRTAIEKMGAHNILMIVPNISLVRQGVEDFKEYKEFFNSEEVWAKGEYCEGSNLTIGTFQSLTKRCTKGTRNKPNKHYDPHFFDKFDIVLCDEAHTLNCKSINDILAQPFIKDIKVRFGFSGTLPDEGTIDSFGCHSLMGPTIQDITPKELMEEGYITPIETHQIYIDHTHEDLLQDYIECGEYLCSNFLLDEEGKKVELDDEDQQYTMQYKKKLPISLQQTKENKSPEEYRDFLIELCKGRGSNLLLLEQMLVHRSQTRLEKIYDIISNIHDEYNNIILFAHHTEYLKHLYNSLQKKYPDKSVFMIHSQISPKKRASIIEYMNTHNDCILVASYKCVGTGLTFKNINYGIFAQSFKSKIIVGQSIGRGLGLSPNKEVFTLYDIVDTFPTKRLYLQGLARKKIFDNVYK